MFNLRPCRGSVNLTRRQEGDSQLNFHCPGSGADKDSDALLPEKVPIWRADPQVVVHYANKDGSGPALDCGPTLDPGRCPVQALCGLDPACEKQLCEVCDPVGCGIYRREVDVKAWGISSHSGQNPVTLKNGHAHAAG